MASLEDIGDFAGDNILPLAAGLAITTAVVNPRIYRSVARPLLKGAIKQYLMIRERLSGVKAGLSKEMHTVYSEAENEMQKQTTTDEMTMQPESAEAQ
ncbi:MAG TPA: hypothetical protein VHV83_06465 [Armatimonadota bacterium]|nr:hypothetical protein [Armatimonadota bacterium]